MAKVDILNYISDSNILRSTYDTDTNELDITDVPQNLNSVITLGQGGGGAEVEELNVTANGTYTAPTGKAYSPVNVNIPVPSFAVSDFLIPSGTWETKYSIPNKIKSGGCVHFRITVPETPLIGDDSQMLISFGRNIDVWSGSDNCTFFIMVYSSNPDGISVNSIRIRIRGQASSSQGFLNVYRYKNADNTIDIKLYKDRFVDVLTGTTYMYSSDAEFSAIANAMSNMDNYNYINVGKLYNAPAYAGGVITLFSIEDE